jgi:hypothetical protein
VVPIAWEEPSFAVDGHELRIVGPLQGDHVHATGIFVPAIAALIAGDLVFDNIYPWLGEHTPAQRQDWLRSLDVLEALGARIVVSGHQLPGTAPDPAAIGFTRDYLKTFNAAAESSRSSDELAAKIRAAFPAAQDVLDGFILGNSAKVGAGEMPPWDE